VKTQNIDPTIVVLIPKRKPARKAQVRIGDNFFSALSLYMATKDVKLSQLRLIHNHNPMKKLSVSEVRDTSIEVTAIKVGGRAPYGTSKSYIYEVTKLMKEGAKC
jgi:hypothetical protein